MTRWIDRLCWYGSLALVVLAYYAAPWLVQR